MFRNERLFIWVHYENNGSLVGILYETDSMRIVCTTINREKMNRVHTVFQNVVFSVSQKSYCTIRKEP